MTSRFLRFASQFFSYREGR